MSSVPLAVSLTRVARGIAQCVMVVAFAATPLKASAVALQPSGSDAGAATDVAPPASEAPAPAPASAKSWTDSLSIGGFGTTWFRVAEPPEEGRAPQAAARIRFARLVFKAKPADSFATKVVLAFDNSNPLFNLEMTWSGISWANLTAGQFKIPFGAEVLTPAANMRLMDRPAYNAAMTKARYRDVGIKIGSGKKALAGGKVNYSLAVMNGSGVGGPTGIAPTFRALLLVGRLTGDVGPVLFGKGKLELGLSGAFTRDPAQADAAAAKNYLGTSLTPFEMLRQTRLLGADLTASVFNVWLRAEVMHLVSTGQRSPEPEITALGWNVDLGYTIGSLGLQPIVRVEQFDRNLDEEHDEKTEITFGFNFEPNQTVLVGLYAAANVDEAGPAGDNKPDNHIDARFQLKF